MSTKATIKALTELKGVTPEIAKQVLEVWNTLNSEQLFERYPNTARYMRERHRTPSVMALRMYTINDLLEMHGVLVLGISTRTGHAVFYCNSGDFYAPTVYFNGHSMRVGCIGDLVEGRAIRREDAS